MKLVCNHPLKPRFFKAHELAYNTLYTMCDAPVGAKHYNGTTVVLVYSGILVNLADTSMTWKSAPDTVMYRPLARGACITLTQE